MVHNVSQVMQVMNFLQLFTGHYSLMRAYRFMKACFAYKPFLVEVFVLFVMLNALVIIQIFSNNLV